MNGHRQNILLVGWALPRPGTDGAMLFTQRQAEALSGLGHHVEIFTICRPEKLTGEQISPWCIRNAHYAGVPYHILSRPYGLLHTDPLNPLQSVREPQTAAIFENILRQKNWDRVHFNEANPLELIEIAHRADCRVTYAFHNLYALYPHEHLFSHSLFKRNPCSDMTIYDPTPLRAIKEYQAMGTLSRDVSASELSRLTTEFGERLQYGRYLLEEVVDSIQEGHSRFLEAARSLFNLNLSRALPNTQPHYNFDVKHAAAVASQKQTARPLVFAELANIQRFKGQHILILLADELHDFEGQFEIRLYGGVNDPWYMQYLQNLLDEDPFRARHVRFCGVYHQESLPTIAKEIHVHISTIPLHPYISGSQLETAPLGVLPIIKEDILFERCFSTPLKGALHYRSGDVKALAAVAAALLTGEMDTGQAFHQNAAAMIQLEQYDAMKGAA